MSSWREVLNDEVGFLCYEVLGKDGSMGEVLLSHLFKIYVLEKSQGKTGDEISYLAGQRDIILSLYEVIDNYKRAADAQEEDSSTQPEVYNDNPSREPSG